MSNMKRHLLELQEREAQRLAERNKHAKHRMGQSGLFPQVMFDDYKQELDKAMDNRQASCVVSPGTSTGRFTGIRHTLVIIDEVFSDGTSKMQQELIQEDYSKFELRIVGYLDQLPPAK
jgi:hypothetical protein